MLVPGVHPHLVRTLARTYIRTPALPRTHSLRNSFYKVKLDGQMHWAQPQTSLFCAPKLGVYEKGSLGYGLLVLGSRVVQVPGAAVFGCFEDDGGFELDDGPERFVSGLDFGSLEAGTQGRVRAILQRLEDRRRRRNEGGNGLSPTDGMYDSRDLAWIVKDRLCISRKVAIARLTEHCGGHDPETVVNRVKFGGMASLKLMLKIENSWDEPSSSESESEFECESKSEFESESESESDPNICIPAGVGVGVSEVSVSSAAYRMLRAPRQSTGTTPADH